MIANRLCSLLVLFWISMPTLAAETPPSTPPSPHAIEIPSWFKESFLDLDKDIKEAAAEKKRVMLYFGQDGCPYCTKLMQVNFSQKDIVAQMHRYYDAIALNIWGDREVTWLDGKTRTEKEFAAFLRVQFTPTLLFIDEQGMVVLRINGYYPPHKLRAALDYVGKHMENQTPFHDYLKTAATEPSSGKLHDEPFFLTVPHDLQRTQQLSTKPLMVLFEQKECAECDEMHNKGFKDKYVLDLLKQFNVVRLSLFGKESLITPNGKKMTEAEWGRALNVAYTPGIVFFDTQGKEVFRVDAYLKSFHLASSLDYVASKSYLTQPNFQRFIESRADKMRKAGIPFDIWQ
ncbi:thioredoxin family protein [Sulfurirhabdus autotrophica]|uniref:Thioredoxin-related protein n=1 Tax=Sulfurirhabdus autotrophica TaxID=1706046 RepID=A0A4R3XYV9_9PROT|nr:thioredoxin fold domain-containing protein [Sulfurirhabdus autotrophica]TCV84091.1 thioredoxin-related protein [Sulfurirhabdus autotrophica]